MDKEEKRELIADVTICSFLFLGVIASTAYCFVQKEYLTFLSGIVAIILGLAKLSGPFAYYKERFNEIKQEKEKHKVA